MIKMHFAVCTDDVFPKILCKVNKIPTSQSTHAGVCPKRLMVILDLKRSLKTCLTNCGINEMKSCHLYKYSKYLSMWLELLVFDQILLYFYSL